MLKLCIEKMLGRKVISSTDCRYLLNDITKKLDTSISFNTLRRFFNLMGTTHVQSVYTLDTLAVYCGFTSWNDFTSHPPDFIEQDDSNLLFYIVMLYKTIVVKDSNDTTFSNLVHQTINFLEYYPSLIDPFQFEIAKTSNGQTFYFEQFVNIDALNSFYGNGLIYYLQEKKTMDAQIFGNHLLILKHWLSSNNNELEKYYNIIIQYDVNKKSDPAIAASFFASQFYYLNSMGLNTEAIIIKARQYYSTLSLSPTNHNAILKFLTTILQALLLTGEYEEVFFYTDDFIKPKMNVTISVMDKMSCEVIILFKSLALLYNGNKSAGKELISTINPCNFNGLAKQFFTILYLTAKQFEKKSSFKEEQIRYLVEKTGFIKLLEKNKSPNYSLEGLHQSL